MTNNHISLTRKRLLVKGELNMATKLGNKEEITRCNRKLFNIERDIKALAGGGIAVSDHAIVRHFERICNINREHLEEMILPKKYHAMAAKLGKCEIPLEDGSVVVVQDNTVVTVVYGGNPPSHKAAEDKKRKSTAKAQRRSGN